MCVELTKLKKAAEVTSMKNADKYKTSDFRVCETGENISEKTHNAFVFHQRATLFYSNVL